MFGWLKRTRAAPPPSNPDWPELTGPVPLLLPGDGKRIFSLYGPLNNVGSYVGHLLSRGAAVERIPDEFRAAAALERYVGNVEGEGHALFAENAADELRDILAEAAKGCELFGLAEIGSIIVEYRTALELDRRWEGVALEDGSQAMIFGETCAAVDKRLYAVKADEPEILDAVDAVPEMYRAEIRQLQQEDSLYRGSLPYLRGRVWVLNHPRLEWHVGPYYFDRVAALAEQLR